MFCYTIQCTCFILKLTNLVLFCHLFSIIYFTLFLSSFFELITLVSLPCKLIHSVYCASCYSCIGYLTLIFFCHILSKLRVSFVLFPPPPPVLSATAGCYKTEFTFYVISLQWWNTVFILKTYDYVTVSVTKYKCIYLHFTYTCLIAYCGFLYSSFFCLLRFLFF